MSLRAARQYVTDASSGALYSAFRVELNDPCTWHSSLLHSEHDPLHMQYNLIHDADTRHIITRRIYVQQAICSESARSSVANLRATLVSFAAASSGRLGYNFLTMTTVSLRSCALVFLEFSVFVYLFHTVHPYFWCM